MMPPTPRLRARDVEGARRGAGSCDVRAASRGRVAAARAMTLPGTWIPERQTTHRSGEMPRNVVEVHCRVLIPRRVRKDEANASVPRMRRLVGVLAEETVCNP